jgi:plastocyanin
MKAKFTMLLLALAVGAFAFAGCGGDDNNDSSSSDTGASAPSSSESTPSESTTDTSAASSGGGGGEELKLSADPSGALKFDKTELSAKAGQVSIVMDNPSSVPHAVAIEGNGVDKDGETVMQGEKSTAGPVELKAGTYTFYCPVDGHEAAGMKGTLTVK